MTRDMELVRKILLAMQEHPDEEAAAVFAIPGYTHGRIGHHVWLMADGGLITAAEITAVGDLSPISAPVAITWKGHEFLKDA